MTQLPHILLLLGLLAPPAATPDRSPEHGNGTGASPPQLQQREGKLIQQDTVKRDDQKLSPAYSGDERAEYQRAQEQAIAESGVNGFRSSQRLRTSPKAQIKPYLLNVNVIQSDPIITKEQRTEYWKNKAETLQKQLDELQKIEKSMMSRE